jgi:phosphoribosylanthranilate isomerase
VSASPRPRVKICGLTTVADAELAVALGADLLGLNFHPPSPRYVDREAARAIAAAVRGRAELAGVFVEADRATRDALDAELGLDWIQLHGRPSAAEAAHHGARTIQVFRLEPGGAPPPLADFAGVGAFLFDVWHPTLAGGTGEAWDYRQLALLPRLRPFFVAGGLRPETVRRALAESRAEGVDLCSGVESEPGRKDPELLARLFQQLPSSKEVLTHGSP